MKDVMLLSEKQYYDLIYLLECTHEGEYIEAMTMEGDLMIVQTSRGLYGTKVDLPALGPAMMMDVELERKVIFKPVEVRERGAYDYHMIDREKISDDEVYNSYSPEEV